MRSGIILPGGTATEQLELAVLAEDHCWDGVLVWEASFGIDAPPTIHTPPHHE